MDEETLVQFILRMLAQQGGAGLGPPTMLVETPWGPVEVIDDLPIYEDTATVNGYGAGNPEFYDGGMSSEQLIGENPYATWGAPGPMNGMVEPWFDYDPLAGGNLYDSFGGTTTGDMQGSNIGIYTGPMIEEDDRKRTATPPPAALGRGLEEVLRGATLLARTEKPERTNPSTARNARSTLGRGLQQALQASVAQPRTEWRTTEPLATQRNTYQAPVYQPVAQRAAVPIQVQYQAPRSTAGQSLRSSVPGLNVLRNRSR